MQAENLEKNTTYNVTATIFTANFEYHHLSHVKSFKTIESDNYILEMISNKAIKLSYGAGDNSSALITTIEWEPTEGKHTS